VNRGTVRPSGLNKATGCRLDEWVRGREFFLPDWFRASPSLPDNGFQRPFTRKYSFWREKLTIHYVMPRLRMREALIQLSHTSSLRGAEALRKNIWLHGAEPFLRSRQLRSYSRISRHFMESECSLPCSQEPSIGTYPEPDQSSPYHPILSL
jgi:hypothetical protein